MTAERNLWLKSVRIGNFRGYGPNFELELPTAGCVVLLSGANGLGKTSFFEAVEWGLTSNIARLQRFGKPSKLELMRKSPHVAACEVGLTFLDTSEGNRLLERRCVLSGGVEVTSGTPQDAVVALLRNADREWAVNPENLVRYLFLTHIHPQSAPLRLIARSAEDRWGWVSQLAGTERLETVRQHVRASKNSLTRIVGEREELLEARRKERADWDDWVEQYTRLREQTTELGGARTPDDTLAEVRRLRVALGEPMTEDDPTDRDGAALDSVASTTRLIATRRKTLQTERTLLAGLRDGAARWAALRAEISAKETLADDVQNRIVTTREELDKRDRGAETHRLAFASAEAVERESKQLGEAISSVQEARTKRNATAEVTERLQLEIAERDREVEAQRAMVEHAANELNTLHFVEREIAATESQRSAIESTRKEAAGLPALRLEASRIEELRRVLVTELREIERQLLAARAALESTTEGLRHAQRQLEDVQRAASVVTQSIASIASHIREDDAECPVCKSTFPTPGTLKRLAESAATLLDPVVAPAQLRLSEGEQELGAVQDHVARLQRAASQKSAEIENCDQLSRDVGEKVEAIRSLPLLAGVPETDISTSLARREAAATITVLQLNERRRGLGGEEDLAHQLRALEAVHRELARAQDNARAQEVAARRRSAELATEDSRLTNFRIDPSASDADLAERGAAADRVAGTAKAEVERLRSTFEEASEARNQIRDQVAALSAQEKRIRDEASELNKRASQILGTWPAHLGVAPSELALDKAEGTLAQDLAMLDSISSDLQRMAAGLHEWMRAEQVRDLERRLREQAGARSFEEEAARLDTATAAARREHELAIRVRQAANKLGDTLRERTSSFNEMVLEPIQGLFARYLRALIHDERFHHVGFEPHTASTAGSLHFQLRVPDWEALADVEAEMILSEGQLAELSLAALFATSSAYRWSDWRALLLDDPTQYNDLVHATSLLEVVRNLAHFEQYQVFISTHDLQQAAFFRRKLEAMHVPWVECRFDSHSEHGLEYNVTSAGRDLSR
jgi:DNA repair exonuclease SbcCD ATPase subunit